MVTSREIYIGKSNELRHLFRSLAKQCMFLCTVLVKKIQVISITSKNWKYESVGPLTVSFV